MRLSISARIFGGFLVVLLAFGGVMGYTFHRMNRLRQDLHLINKSYLRLALKLAEMHIHQGNLAYAVADRGARTSGLLRAARLFRLNLVQEALQMLDQSRPNISTSREQETMDRIRGRLQDLARSFQKNDALFKGLFSDSGPAPHPQMALAVERLRRLEAKLVDQIRKLFEELRGQVNAAALQVEQDERNAIWASLVLAVLSVLVSLAVTFGAQLTLRPLRTLVAGTKRIGSGDYGHRVVVRSRDELGLLAREFNNMAAAVKEREQRLIHSERMAAAGRIASHVTHELRNPLSSISLNTELLQEEFEDLEGDRAAEALSLCQAIRKEVDRLTEFTEEFLRFARLPRPHMQTEDINELLLDLLSFVSGELKGKGIEVIQRVEPRLPVVEADENQLRQAFLNLLRNAAEAMAAAGGTLTIDAESRNKHIEVRIADTGTGIQPEDLPHIFEPFFSTKESGTGLGLALTRQIILEHGGSIEVQSHSGQGTAFTIRLPLSARGST